MPTPKKERNPWVLAVAACIVFIIGGGIAALSYLAASSKTVYIDNAQIEAPLVDLSPTAPGVLKEVYVTEGQTVPPNTVVAEVGTELIKSTAGGLVVTVNNNIGKQVSPTDIIVETIDPAQLRVVGQVQEDKGLVDINVGDKASFTVDAFGSTKFEGVVSEVAPTAKSSDVVFNVSNQRQEQNFDVKVQYDTAQYPQLKNGMSAKIWVYKQ
ncbi:MAG: HlyD family efflux transporter periplasmic adaptor subunit [Patescibacteria group bacterium]|nr:HlyD family efflux transporter periplasmic adaptor subunit [Patescibacteria group bacterium]